MTKNGRWRSVGTFSLAALLAAAPLDLGFRPVGGIAHLSMAAAKDGDSGHGGSNSGSSNSGSDSGHGGSGDSHRTEDRASGGRDPGNQHRNGGDAEVVYPDGWKEEIHDGIFELRDPDGRKVMERRATAADIARMRALSR
jgi:hypothetical protein